MDFEEYMALLTSLAEASDGTRADDYATLKDYMTTTHDEALKDKASIESLEEKNGQLRKENFKLFSRMPTTKHDEPPSHQTDDFGGDSDEPVTTLKDIVNDKGFWKLD